jgi:hypothetical protein
MGADRKKVIVAVGLICVMVFMWVRVIAGKGPEGAAAIMLQPEANPTLSSNSGLDVCFVDLPKVRGRNDVLTTDFFAADGWQQFTGPGANGLGSERVEVVVNDGAEEAIRRVAGKLKLQAILLDKTPQAFINDRLLLVGDKLTVKDGGNVYEFEVVRISQNVVSVKCKDAQITMKLVKVVEGGDS